MPAAWPRFQDIYGEAGVQPSYPRLEDRNGRTYVETLARAAASGAFVVQLVTWNDWGEGTQIEPSVEFGFRDLEATQQQRRRMTPPFSFAAADLRLPLALYAQRKKGEADAATRARMDAVSRLLFAGQTRPARALLAAGSTLSPRPAMR